MASGDFLGYFDALMFVQETTNYPAQGVRNNQWHLAYDKGTDEAAYIRSVMASNYANGGVSVKVLWRSGLTTGNAVWNVDFERQADGGQDTDGDGYTGSPQAATGTTPATIGMLKYTAIAFTNGAQMDSVIAGDVFRLKVSRDADNGSDTLDGDAELVGVALYEV